MRYQGRVTQWEDERGFGFITPNGGGERVFFHIKSLTRASGRPMPDDRVNYILDRDRHGRPRAHQVEIVGRRMEPSPRRDAWPAPVPLALAAGLAAVLVALLTAGLLPGIVVAAYALGSMATVFAYAVDKRAAKLGRQRIPESTLHLLALVGGWPGAIVAQHALRHKYRKTAFMRLFWASAGANVAILLWLALSAAGQALVREVLRAAG